MAFTKAHPLKIVKLVHGISSCPLLFWGNFFGNNRLIFGLVQLISDRPSMEGLNSPRDDRYEFHDHVICLIMLFCTGFFIYWIRR